MKTVFEGSLFKILQTTVVDRNGEIRKLEYIDGRDVVRVYAITPDRTGMYVLRELPPGLSEWQTRVISGGIEPHEDGACAAARELKEECGIVSNDIEMFHRSWQSSKILNPVYHFVAWNSVVESEAKLEELENIKTYLVDISDIKRDIMNGYFHEDSVSFGFIKLAAIFDLV